MERRDSERQARCPVCGEAWSGEGSFTVRRDGHLLLVEAELCAADSGEVLGRLNLQVGEDHPLPARWLRQRVIPSIWVELEPPKDLDF